MKDTFTFRDVLQRLGIPLDNVKHNWAIGQRLRHLAQTHGFQVTRSLEQKTNPEPSVGAPHVIASYPMAMFPIALRSVEEYWADRDRQLDLFGAAFDGEEP